MDIVTISNGLLTPLIAIIALYIAYQQYYTNKKQGDDRIKIELYKKRYKVFTKIKRFLVKVDKEGKISINNLSNFIIETKESKFLFDDDIIDYLEEIKNNALSLNQFVDHVPNKFVNKEELRKLTNWFTFERENIEIRFVKYLKFTNI